MLRQIQEDVALYRNWRRLLVAIVTQAAIDGYRPVARTSRRRQRQAREFLADPQVQELCKDHDIDVPWDRVKELNQEGQKKADVSWESLLAVANG
jgi:hypothetical protein